jgi:D-psicose/D-tagatose/L-ribulose 3-epimerase
MSADPAIRRAAVDSMIHYVNFTSKMKARILDGTYVQPWNVELDEGRAKEAALADAVECLKPVAKAAEDCGVILSMEILNRFEGALVNTMAEAVDVLDRVGSPNLMITADSFHMNIEEDGIAEAIRLGGKRIGHVHIGEANRKLPGNGSMINWNELFDTLREVGYNGMFIFEAFVLAGGAVSEGVKLRRDLSGGATADEMTEQLRKSLAFVKGKFEK